MGDHCDLDMSDRYDLGMGDRYDLGVSDRYDLGMGDHCDLGVSDRCDLGNLTVDLRVDCLACDFPDDSMIFPEIERQQAVSWGTCHGLSPLSVRCVAAVPSSRGCWMG